MIKNEFNNSTENVCDLKYLNELMGGKKKSILDIMDVFIKQISEELQSVNDAILKTEYSIIKNFSHTMKSTVSIMGISKLTPILQKMEDLGAKAEAIEKIIELSLELNLICKQAIEEIERERLNYI